MKKLISCLVLGLIVHSFCPAEELKPDQELSTDQELKTDHLNAPDMLKTRLDAVIEVLASSELSLEEKDKRILKTVTPMFDFPLMAKLTLGRTRWNALTKAEQDQFTKSFIDHLRNSYRDKITLYTDQEIVFKPSVAKSKSKVEVPTELKSKDSSFTILYLLWKKTKAPWKIYDVEIQGVSVVKNYQSQFKEILQKGTIDDLLKQLKETAEKDTPTQ